MFIFSLTDSNRVFVLAGLFFFGSRPISEKFRTILHEGTDKRTQYSLEALFAVRRSNYKFFPSIVEELDLIEDEDKIGLVSGHAYAVLEIIEAHGVRMLLLKNPWGHLSFKGKFSVNDQKSWTP